QPNGRGQFDEVCVYVYKDACQADKNCDYIKYMHRRRSMPGNFFVDNNYAGDLDKICPNLVYYE
ncbi:MAG: hypothetical protein RIB86_16525, partial [Imperialibacter sp.]